MTPRLVLSLFPGADLLGRGFEAEGFCVVRGPDTLFAQDIRSFTPPPDTFEGIIGGPPCQDFSRARRRPPTGHGRAMLNEFVRCVLTAQPSWWLMENVPGVPDLFCDRYVTQRFNLYASEFGLSQRRNRSFQFGSRDGLHLHIPRGTQSHLLLPAAMASDGDHGRRRPFTEICRLQGLPGPLTLPGLSRAAKFRLVGNGVALPVAAAVARSIRDRASSVHTRLCPCNCGRALTGRQRSATVACRKRLQHSRARSRSHR